LAKVLLGAADCLGDDYRGVVRRLGDERLESLLDGEGLPRFQTELYRMLTGGFGGYRQGRVELELAGFELLEQQIERHDLGQRRRVARLVRLGLMQDLAGVGVGHDVGITRSEVGAGSDYLLLLSTLTSGAVCVLKTSSGLIW
jgi:hypothetical protein